MKAGVYALLSDGAESRRIAWALPRGTFIDGRKQLWDLDADVDDPATRRFTWATVVDSISRFLDGHRVPLKIEHGQLDDLYAAAGEAIPTDDPLLREALAYGMVVGAEAVDAKTAASYGVQADGEALYLLLDPIPVVRTLLDAGMLPYTSPGLLAGYTDDEGQHFPLILRELSFTLTPRQTRRQISTLAVASLAAALLSEASMYEGTEEPEKTATMEDEVVVVDDAMTLDKLAEMLMAVMDRLTAVEAAHAAMMDSEAMVEDEDTDTVDLSERERAATKKVEDLLKRVADLEREKAAIRVAADLSERQFDPSAKAALTDLLVRNPAQYAAIVNAAPKGHAVKRRPVSSVSADLSDAHNLSGMSREEKAREYVKQGKNITEAWSLATQGA